MTDELKKELMMETSLATRPTAPQATWEPLRFRPVDADAMPRIAPLLAGQGYRTCDFTQGGIFMWADFFGYQYCICEETLFIRGRAEGGGDETAFSLPVGRLPLARSMAMLADYCKSRSLPLLLSAVPQPAAREIAGRWQCTATPLDGWSDYLYDAKQLASLAGHRFNKKRNHLNKFFSLIADARYERLCDANLGAVQSFFARFRGEVQKEGDLFRHEEAVTERLLPLCARFGFVGGVLWAGGQVVAFCVGELQGDTLYVHVEKAARDCPGAGEAINHLFARDMVASFGARYINREEDVGDPGLRRAKLSYHPLELLHKFDVRFGDGWG